MKTCINKKLNIFNFYDSDIIDRNIGISYNELHYTKSIFVGIISKSYSSMKDIRSIFNGVDTHVF